MKSVNSIEKKKLVFYRNLIDSLLSLEEYIEGKDEEISDMLLQRIEQLYERTDKEMGKTYAMSPLMTMLEVEMDWSSSDFGIFNWAYCWFNVFLFMLIFGGMILDKLGVRIDRKSVV